MEKVDLSKFERMIVICDNNITFGDTWKMSNWDDKKMIFEFAGDFTIHTDDFHTLILKVKPK